MKHRFSYVFLHLGYRQHMRTYENTKIYKVVNDVDDSTFFGYTSMSLPSRLASLKKESSNTSCSGAVHEHIRAVGKEHFKLVLVEVFPCKCEDEVTARIAALMREDVKPYDASTELEAKVERLERLIEQCHTKDNEKPMSSCETGKLHQELEEQRKLISKLQEMVQQLSKTVAQLQPLPRIEPVTISDSTSSDAHTGGSPLEQPPTSPHQFDNPSEPSSPKTVETPESRGASSSPEHFNISDDDLEEERPKCIPIYDLTDDMFKVLKGKIDQDDVNRLRGRYTKTVRLGKHMQAHPKDEDNKTELMFYKESLAKRTALLRLDAGKNGFDQPCLRLLDTIEKEAMIGNNMMKKAKRLAVDRRKRLSYEDEVNDEDDKDDAKEDKPPEHI